MRSLFLVIVIATLSSCTQMTEYIMEEIFVEYPIIERPIDEVWLETEKFVYIEEPEGQNDWKSPKRFKKDGWGDCEDFSTYLIYQLGPTSELRSIVRDGTKDTIDKSHAIVYFNGKYIEPQKYGKYYEEGHFQLVWVMAYDAVMKRSTVMYTQ